MAGGRTSDARTPPEPPAGFGRWPFWRRWFGQRSERFIARYLRKLGWRVLAANVADREGELDLLALDGDTLVVVEVRSRSVPDPRAAAETVDYAKQRRLTEATVRFLSRRRLLGINVRFDVLALGWPAGVPEPAVLHVRNAFEATGRFQMFN
jgi:putative endonuclease